MLPKRRKQEKPTKASSPLDDKARALAEKQQKLQAEIERAQRLIEDAPKIREEQKRVRREQLIKTRSSSEGRRNSRVALHDPRHGFELNAAIPARQKSLRAERQRGRFLFFVLLCTFAAVVYWAYFIFSHQ